MIMRVFLLLFLVERLCATHGVNAFVPPARTTCHFPHSLLSAKGLLSNELLLFGKKKDDVDEDLRYFQTPWVFESVARLGGAFGPAKRPHEDRDTVLQEKGQAQKRKFIRVSAALTAASVGTCAYLLRVYAAVATENKARPLFGTIGMGQMMAAGLISLVARAAKRNHLKSTTYKQLNLVLALYGILLGISTAMSRLGQADIPLPLWALLPLCIATLFHSLQGYQVGVHQEDWILPEGMRASSMKDMATQAKRMARHLLPVPTPQNLQAFVYWMAALTITCGTAVTLAQAITIGAVSPPSIVWTANLAQCGLMLQLSGIFLVLKDAVDRGHHLEGTRTFLWLNCLTSVASAFLSAPGVVLSSVPWIQSWATRVLATISISTAIFAVQGLRAEKYKHERIL